MDVRSAQGVADGLWLGSGDGRAQGRADGRRRQMTCGAAVMQRVQGNLFRRIGMGERRRDMMAMTAAMMVRIAIIGIARHLIPVIIGMISAVVRQLHAAQLLDGVRNGRNAKRKQQADRGEDEEEAPHDTRCTANMIMRQDDLGGWRTGWDSNPR